MGCIQLVVAVSFLALANAGLVLKKEFRECNLKAVPGKPIAFKNGGIKLHCSPGTVFNEAKCTCDDGVGGFVQKVVVKDGGSGIFRRPAVIDPVGPIVLRKDVDPVFIRKDVDPVFIRKDVDPVFIRKDVDPVFVRKDVDPVFVRKDVRRFDPIVTKRVIDVPRKGGIIVDKFIGKKDRLDCYDNDGKTVPVVGVCFAFRKCVYGEERYFECPEHFRFDYDSGKCVEDSSCKSACPPQVEAFDGDASKVRGIHLTQKKELERPELYNVNSP